MADALLVVDVQHQLVEELAPDRRAAFLATLNDLLERARARAMPVVYIRHNDEVLRLGSPAWEIATYAFEDRSEADIVSAVNAQLRDAGIGVTTAAEAFA